MANAIQRCPHCGSVLPTKTMPVAIRACAAGGPTSMERIKAAARAIKPMATDKQIYNAIAALVRRGQMRKIAHGFYMTAAL